MTLREDSALKIFQKEYRQAVTEFILKLMKRPKASYNDTNDLVIMLHGHYVAFWQQGYSGKSFNDSFSEWLKLKTEVSVCQGWGNAIKILCQENVEQTQCLLEKWISEFLQNWNHR